MDGNGAMDAKTTETLTGAEIVLRALADQGVDTVFGYPGGAVLPIYDAIYSQQRVRHILVRHEQGAGHMAEGYARSTGRCGVPRIYVMGESRWAGGIESRRRRRNPAW